MALDRARKSGKILISHPVLSELSEVLHRSRFRRYIEENDIRLFLVALTREAEWVEADSSIAACRDSKDDKFLSLAVSGQATHIVSGDRDLLELHPFRGIQILSPGSFVGMP